MGDIVEIYMIFVTLSVLCPWSIFVHIVAPRSLALIVSWYILFSLTSIFFFPEKRILVVLQYNNTKVFSERVVMIIFFCTLARKRTPLVVGF